MAPETEQGKRMNMTAVVIVAMVIVGGLAGTYILASEGGGELEGSQAPGGTASIGRAVENEALPQLTCPPGERCQIDFSDQEPYGPRYPGYLDAGRTTLVFVAESPQAMLRWECTEGCGQPFKLYTDDPPTEYTWVTHRWGTGWQGNPPTVVMTFEMDSPRAFEFYLENA